MEKQHYPAILLLTRLLVLIGLCSVFSSSSFAEQTYCAGARPDCQKAYAEEVKRNGILARCPSPCFHEFTQRGQRCITPPNLSCRDFYGYNCAKVGCRLVECTTDFQCGFGKKCDENSGKCFVWPPQIGAKACRFNSECLSDECVSGQCRCNVNVPCIKGTRCRSDNVCVPDYAPDGSRCTADRQCANACIDGVCQPRRKWGQSCGNNADCQSRGCQNNMCLCSRHSQCPNNNWACSSPLEGIPNGNWHCYYQGRKVW